MSQAFKYILVTNVLSKVFLWSGAYYVCARLVEKTRNQEDLDDPREDDEDEHDDSDLEIEMH